jgi:hypothetical protein
MVLLGWVEIFQLFKFYGYRHIIFFLQPIQRSFYKGPVIFIKIIDAGAILGPDVRTLPVDSQGVNDFIIQVQEEFQSQQLRIIFYLNCFRMSGISVANLFIAGICSPSVGIAYLGGYNSGNGGHILFQTPKTTPG